jgi:hypothetical protein
MSKKPAPHELAARQQTAAALVLHRARLAVGIYAPPTQARAELLDGLGRLIEQITPRSGELPQLRFTRPVTPAGACGRRRTAGME